MRKVNFYPDVFKTFKRSASCFSYYTDLLENGRYKEALHKILNFFNEAISLPDFSHLNSRKLESDNPPRILHKKQKTPTFVNQDKVFENERKFTKDREELLGNLAFQNQKLLQLNQQIYDTMSGSSSTRSKAPSKLSCYISEESPREIDNRYIYDAFEERLNLDSPDLEEYKHPVPIKQSNLSSKPKKEINKGPVSSRNSQ